MRAARRSLGGFARFGMRGPGTEGEAGWVVRTARPRRPSPVWPRSVGRTPACILLLATGLLLGHPAAVSRGADRPAEFGEAVPLQTSGASAADSTGGRPMNLDVQGANIRTVLLSISEFSGTNIVADRDVEGPVSLRLIQVPWRRALEIVCQSAGLIVLPGNGIIRVATAKTWREEGIAMQSDARKQEDLLPLTTRVYTIRYASAQELKDAVGFALSKRGSAQVDARTNTLLVNDIEARLSDVDRLVLSLDTETRQVEISARVVDVDRTAARQLGIDWSLENLHSNSQRVSGSVSVTEPISPVHTSGNVHLGVVRSFGNLDATLEAMERKDQAHLISDPKITTVNNRKARILVGKEVPLITLDASGNTVTELKKVGITLEVTPYINSENRITMDLHPEVSDLSSQATVQGGLIFTTTEADTRVMVNDGETAVIGGFIQSTRTVSTLGIPLLRSLPLIGGLFGRSDTNKEDRELLIFVTPHVATGIAQKQ